MAVGPSKAVARATRNPERTRESILAAAMHEFAAHGFAGARVDAIARRSRCNKRMLYHYYRNKAGLFQAVLHQKIVERMARVEEAAVGRESELPVWFAQNCRDTDWVRLLGWESLQTSGDQVQNETERRRYSQWIAARIRQKQADGRLRNDVSAMHLQMVLMSLTMFPLAMPQLTWLVTGRSPHDPKFQREYSQFLETIASSFRPVKPAAKTRLAQAS